jgi:hypothetical protein
LQVPRDPLADGIEHDAHELIPPTVFSGRLFSFSSMVESRCTLVHTRSPSIMIDSPWRLLRGCGCGKFGAVRDAEFALAIGNFWIIQVYD